MSEKNLEKRKAGFTLIEMLLVVTILAILLPLIAFSYSNSKIRLDFDRSVTEVLSQLRNARNLAIANVEMGGAAVQFYGVRIDKTAGKVTAYYDDPTNVIGTVFDLSDLRNSAVASMELFVGDNIGADPTGTDSGGVTDIKFLPPFGEVEMEGSYSKVRLLFTSRLGAKQEIVINDVGGIPEKAIVPGP